MIEWECKVKMVEWKCKVLSSLYYDMSATDDFESHKNYFYNTSIDRKYCLIIDMVLFMKSHFNEGYEMRIRRVSEKSKYYLK